MSRNIPGPNAGTLDDLLYGSIVTAADGKPAVAVSNSDGSSIGNGGTGGSAGQIQGNTANGGTPTGNPVTVAGSDGTNIRTIQTDTSGIVKIVMPYSGSSSSFVQGASVDNTTALGNPNLTGAKYNVTPPTYDDGDIANSQADVNGNTKVTEATALSGEDLGNNVLGVQSKPVASATYSASGGTALLNSVAVAVKTSSGTIKSVYASNTNAAARWLQVFNKASAPATNDVPVFSFYLPASTGVSEIGTEFFGEGGYFLATGVAIGVSTAAGTFQAATATDHVINYTFV